MVLISKLKRLRFSNRNFLYPHTNECPSDCWKSWNVCWGGALEGMMSSKFVITNTGTMMKYLISVGNFLLLAWKIDKRVRWQQLCQVQSPGSHSSYQWPNDQWRCCFGTSTARLHFSLLFSVILIGTVLQKIKFWTGWFGEDLLSIACKVDIICTVPWRYVRMSKWKPYRPLYREWLLYNGFNDSLKLTFNKYVHN